MKKESEHAQDLLCALVQAAEYMNEWLFELCKEGRACWKLYVISAHPKIAKETQGTAQACSFIPFQLQLPVIIDDKAGGGDSSGTAGLCTCICRLFAKYFDQ